MKEKTMKALKKSIIHWQDNVYFAEAGNFRMMTTSRTKCALCNLFNKYETTITERCHGCPVHADTGEQYCHGTPYMKVNAAIIRYDNKAVLKHAKAELKYLISLKEKSNVKTGGTEDQADDSDSGV
jgi:hypothetical protein